MSRMTEDVLQLSSAANHVQAQYRARGVITEVQLVDALSVRERYLLVQRTYERVTQNIQRLHDWRGFARALQGCE